MNSPRQNTTDLDLDNISKMNSPHAIVLPLPCLGHIIPLMHLSRFLGSHGFKITFINTEHNRNIISANNEYRSDQIRMITISDGLSPEDDRVQNPNLFLAFQKYMPAQLEQVIKEINEREDEKKITCLIADCGMAWAFDTAEKMGLRSVAFCPASATHLAVSYFSIPKLMEDGVIDENGFPKNSKKFELAANTPLLDLNHLIWNYTGDEYTQRIMFLYILRNSKALLKTQFILSNSCKDLELSIFTNFPNIWPIGPLPVEQAREFGPQMGYFPEDPTCMAWLDRQQANTVVYVSFGSIAKLDHVQFQELALGLELSQMRFLWIARPDLTDGNDNLFLRQFQERVKERGKISGWCNQKEVLAHPAIACFVSHCGWNSTTEGIKNGLRFLCWPYFADQFANQDYICDVLNVGLRLVKNENGIVSKESINSSLTELMKNDSMMAKAENLKKIVNNSITEGGSSFTNLIRFVEAMKQ